MERRFWAYESALEAEIVCLFYSAGILTRSNILSTMPPVRLFFVSARGFKTIKSIKMQFISSRGLIFSFFGDNPKSSALSVQI